MEIEDIKQYQMQILITMYSKCQKKTQTTELSQAYQEKEKINASSTYKHSENTTLAAVERTMMVKEI